jgi:hypothetical protein
MLANEAVVRIQTQSIFLISAALRPSRFEPDVLLAQIHIIAERLDELAGHLRIIRTNVSSVWAADRRVDLTTGGCPWEGPDSRSASGIGRIYLIRFSSICLILLTHIAFLSPNDRLTLFSEYEVINEPFSIRTLQFISFSASLGCV